MVDVPLTLPEQLFAAALDGDEASLLRVAEQGSVEQIKAHRIAPALAFRAADLRWTHPALDAWREELRLTAGRQMLLELALRRIGETLAEAGLSWMPFKGCDLATRLYERAEERPFGDVDILIEAADLATARQALESSGWQPLRRSRLSLDYLEREGYAWQALNPSGVLLEAHFRLWGWLPTGAIESVMARATSAPELGETARRMPWADAFVLSAVHAWLDGPPRALGRFWELALLVRELDETTRQAVVAFTHSLGVHLPLVLAVESIAKLWPDTATSCQQIARPLEEAMRWPERRVHGLALQGDPLSISFSRLALARLLAHRPSRSGWRGLWRRIWSHPAFVEQATPASWTWPRRRLWFLGRTLRRNLD